MANPNTETSLTAILLVCSGIILLVAGAEWLVSGASRLAALIGISPLVVGLTVVAFGTSAPEMGVSIASAMKGQADLAVGNVVGSNIFNVLFILGVSAIIVPLTVHQKLIRMDIPLMIAVTVMAYWLAGDGNISRPEGAVMFVGLILFTAWCLWSGANESTDVQQEYAEEFGSHSSGPGEPESQQTGIRQALVSAALLLLGLGTLVAGSNLLVQGAVNIARWLGVSELLIGLTIVAAGTSLPEVATSVVAALRGERDIAVGNVIGSNIFNVLGVLGLAAAVSPAGVPVANQALNFDIPVMVAVSLACFPVVVSGRQIARWEGFLFLAYYVLYVVSLVMLATSQQLHPDFRNIIVWLVAPATVITILLSILAPKASRE